MKPHKKFVAVGLTLTIMGLLAGCGTTYMTSPPNNSQVNDTATSAKSAPASGQSPWQPFTSIRMTGAKTGWGTGTGTVWYTMNGGVSWKNITPVQLHKGSDFQPVLYSYNQSRAWVVQTEKDSNSLFIFNTTNGGRTWTKNALKTSNVTSVYMHFYDKNHGMLSLMQDGAMGSEGAVTYQTIDGGQTWHRSATARPVKGSTLPFSGIKSGVTFNNNSDGWLTGSLTHGSGTVYLFHTTDGGHTWTKQGISVPTNLMAAQVTSYPPQFSKAKEGVLPVKFHSSSTSFMLYHTSDGGETWTSTHAVDFPRGSMVPAWSIISTNEEVVTDGTKLLITRSGGRRWKSISSNISFQNIKELDFISLTTGWVLMNSGSLYHTTDGGHSWRRLG